MAINNFLTSQNIKVEIDNNKKIAKAGGEGTVYEINSPSKYKKDYCAKIYHDRVLANRAKIDAQHDKIKYMVKHPVIDNSKDVRICAPVELIYLNNRFVGFIMLKAFKNSEQLTWISTSGYDLKAKKIYPKLLGFDGAQGWRAVYNRLVVSNNIAYAISILHRADHYVLVDTKPENILITASGKVSLIDMDSVQIIDSQGKLKFKSTVYSEHYAPPEHHNGKVNMGVDAIKPSWDSFSFGVIAYELIIGCHPYIGNYRAPFNKGTDTMANIHQGLFLNGSKSAYLENPQTLDLYLKRWNALPKDLCKTFYKAFETGLTKPSERPSMDDWGTALSNAIHEVQLVIKKNGNSSPPMPMPKPPQPKLPVPQPKPPVPQSPKPKIEPGWYIGVLLVLFFLFVMSVL